MCSDLTLRELEHDAAGVDESDLPITIPARAGYCPACGECPGYGRVMLHAPSTAPAPPNPAGLEGA